MHPSTHSHPSEVSPLPFNSSFCWFPFQISDMRMKTKPLFKKEHSPASAQGDHLGLSLSHLICNSSLEKYCDFRCHLRLCLNLSKNLSASSENHFSFIWGRCLLTVWKSHRFKNNIQGCLHAFERTSMQQVPEPKRGTLVVIRTPGKCGGFLKNTFCRTGAYINNRRHFSAFLSSQCVPSNGFREWTDPKNEAKYAVDASLLIGDMGMDVDILETVKHAS